MTVQTLCARAGAAALLLFAGAGVAAAQQPANDQMMSGGHMSGGNQMMMSGAVKQACAGDVKTLCPGVEPGGGRLMQCLHQNSAKVSPKCKAELGEAKAAKGAAKPAAPK